MRAVLVAAFVLILAAPASAWIPNDPGTSGTPGGWQADQWNFLPGTGVDAPRAWDNLIAAGRPGGKGVKIAVLDSGVSYDRSPDLSSIRFVRGHDFCSRTGSGEFACAGEDNWPEDDYGHGTHVASTIAESTNNGKGLTGLAYGATIIPVKVLDKFGDGDEDSIAKGLRYAADQGAQVINMSFEFGSSTTAASEIPRIAAAVKYARPRRPRRRRRRPAARPARLPPERRSALDPPARVHPQEQGLPLPEELLGTSMAAPHVSATAALIIASGVLGEHPTAKAIEQRLKATAHDLGTPGPDRQYGAGLIDAGAATAP